MKNSNRFKFRQWHEGRFHFWGWIGEGFTNPKVVLPSEQFTGLTDKNGKEIYEGDIMKIELPAGGFWGKVTQTKTGKVEYEPDQGGFIVIWEYSRNQHHENLTCDIAFTGEVIGNIHENPDLLK